MPDKLSSNTFLIPLALIAVFAFPALNNVHYDPQPQFWAEISVAWAVLATFFLVLTRARQIAIPAIVLPLALFAIYLLIQPHLLTLDYPGMNYITALEMFVCILLAISINTLKESLGLPRLFSYLCYAILLGCILQSLIGLIQYTGTTKYFGSLIFYDSSHPTTNIFGHFGQRNHYAHYLSWGSFAILYLYLQRKIATWFFAALVVWFSFSLTIAASRSVFIYFAAAVLISLCYALIKRDAQSRRLLTLTLISTGTLFAFEYAYPLLHKMFTVHNNFSSGLERLDSSNGTGRRGAEWAKAWLVFKANPIFGLGWNEYAKESVLLYNQFPNTELNSGLFTNCHNLVLQLLAESGIVGTVIAIGGILWAWLRLLRTSFGLEALVLSMMIATTVAHSLNEYPLWYLYFLAGLIAFLSCDSPLVTLSAKRTAQIAALPILGCIYLMVQSSIIFDQMVDYSDAPDDQPSFNTQAKYLQNLVDHNPLWAYFASYTLDNYINVDSDSTDQLYTNQQQYYYTHKLDSFHPYPDTLIKEGMLAWNLDREREALQLVKLAVTAFPVYNSSFRDTLKFKHYKPLRNLVPTTNK